MAAIYPISDLQKRPAEVKAQAQREVVHLTENGRGAYVLMSEEYFEDYVGRRQDEAVWEAGLIEAIEEGMRDVEEGRVYTLEEMDKIIQERIAELEREEEWRRAYQQERELQESAEQESEPQGEERKVA